MNNPEMVSDVLVCEIVDSPEQAPTYDGGKVKMLRIEKVIVVGKGATSGNPTVDIQLVDQQGNQYLVMATAGIITTMGAAVAGKRQRDTGR